ncbi:unnamed protein product [Owenia fusiformis]|uniref:Uncharacterized protein n=1 Tax=Owenia fusiformis TaxID=6347 RepID=A0A8J1T5T4_OWEFU|nr:unnamed protein product [Owenia fusiformis]
MLKIIDGSKIQRLLIYSHSIYSVISVPTFKDFSNKIYLQVVLYKAGNKMSTKKLLPALGSLIFLTETILCASVRTTIRPIFIRRDTCSSVNVQQCFQAFSNGLNNGANCDLMRDLVQCASQYPECTSDYITKGRAIVFMAGRLRKAGACSSQDIGLTGLSPLVVGSNVGNAIGLSGSAAESSCVASVDTECMNIFHQSLSSLGLCSALDSLISCIQGKQSVCSSPLIGEMSNAMAHQSISAYLQSSGIC